MMGCMTMIRHIAAAVFVLSTLSSGAMAADCYSIGQNIAAQRGGTLLRADPSSSNGRAICRIVIEIPGQNGERPRREQIDVPQN